MMPISGKISRSVGVICAALFASWPVGAFTVTMPTDSPVTLRFEDFKKNSRDGDSNGGRRGSGPRQYRSPGESTDPIDLTPTLKTLALIVASPVLLVGGSLYIGGKKASDWFDEQKRMREERLLREDEHRRWEEEERRRLAVVTAELEQEASRGQEPVYEVIGFLLESAVAEATAAEINPHAGVSLETNVPWKINARQNEFNELIRVIYEEHWKKEEYRPLLRLVTPRDVKAIIGWESRFNEKARQHCGFGVKLCRSDEGQKVDASWQGVGLAGFIYWTAVNPKMGALQVDAHVDERLDPEKSIRGALRLLKAHHDKLESDLRKDNIVVSEEFLRELVVLAHNTGPSKLPRAVRTAAEIWKIKNEDVRMKHLMNGPGNTKAPLSKVLKKAKYRKEASKYLQGIGIWLKDRKAGGLQP